MTRQPEKAPRPLPGRSGRATLKVVRPEGTLVAEHSKASAPKSLPPLFRPSLTIGVEPFPSIARELPPLFALHWEELEQDGMGLALNPDWSLLYDMSQMGRLHIMTARYLVAKDRRPLLVGYIFNFVLPHIYTASDLQGQIHLFYLHPNYRDEPGFLLKWFRENDQFLESLGVKKIMAMTKNSFKEGRVGIIFKRLGYTEVETVWARMV